MVIFASTTITDFVMLYDYIMHGYKFLKDMSEYNRWTQSYRYKTFKAEKDGKLYLFKQAQDDTHKRLIQNELRWRQFVKHLNLEGISSTVVAEHGEDYIVFEWIEAELLAEPSPEGVKRLEQSIDRYSDLILSMDKAADGYNPYSDDTQAVSEDVKMFTLPYLKNRFSEQIETGWLELEDIELSIEAGYSRFDQLEKRFQHGDFTPWHVFVKGDQWVIFDGEHANSTIPRFRDLVHSYTRLATICKRDDLARQLLSRFIKRINEPEDSVWDQLYPIFLSRALGSVIDSYNDRGEVNYRSEARRLMENVKAAKLSALT